MKIVLDVFKGEIPRVSPKLLNTGQAQIAYNTKLWSGELHPYSEGSRLSSLEDLEGIDEYKSLYGYERDTSIQWLTFTDDVDIVKGPVFNDINNRIYITGLEYPIVTDKVLLSDTATTVSVSDGYKVGIEQPTYPTLGTVSGTVSGELETRTYVVTYVREWSDGKLDEGIASAPAQKSTGELYVDVYPEQTIEITNITRPTETNTGIKWIRIYRSAVASDGTVTYNYVYQFDQDPTNVALYDKVTWTGTTFTFTDDIPTIDLQEGLASAEWSPPSDDLTGLISLNNGVLAGFVGNDIYFSEPYQPHAWPSKYRVTMDNPIVGLGRFGNTVVVCTTKYPVLLYVNDPTTVIPQAINELAPCVSKRSIVNANGAVFYATPNGLISIDTSKPTLWTQDSFTRDEWGALNPSSFNAVMYRGSYVCFYASDDRTDVGGMMLNFSEPDSGVVFIDNYTTALYINEREDSLCYVSKEENFGWGVYKWEGEKYRRKDYQWKSKLFTSTEGIANFSAARITFAEGHEITEGSVIEDDDDLMDCLAEHEVGTILFAGDVFSNVDFFGLTQKTCTFTFYVDGEVVFTKSCGCDRPFRLPAGMRGREFEIEVTGNRYVRTIEVATSIQELS